MSLYADLEAMGADKARQERERNAVAAVDATMRPFPGGDCSDHSVEAAADRRADAAAWRKEHSHKLATYHDEGAKVFEALSQSVKPEHQISVRKWDRLCAWMDRHRFERAELNCNGSVSLFGCLVTVR